MNKPTPTAEKLLGEIEGLIRRLAAAQQLKFGQSIADDVAQSLRLFAFRQVPAFERFQVKYPKTPFGAFIGSVLQKEAFAVAKVLVNTIKIPERNKTNWGYCESLDCPIAGDDDGELSLHDVLPGEPEQEPELPALLGEAFGKLRPSDRELAGDCFLREMTLTEYGQKRGISRERVRQLKERVLGVLREDSALAEYATYAAPL